MSNPGNQNSQASSKSNPNNLPPDALQGTDDSQSEFSVNEIRAERRDNESQNSEQASNAEASKENNTAETQSEFSVDERLRGNP